MAHTDELKQHISGWRKKALHYRDLYKAAKVKAKYDAEETEKLRLLLHKVPSSSPPPPPSSSSSSV